MFKFHSNLEMEIDPADSHLWAPPGMHITGTQFYMRSPNQTAISAYISGRAGGQVRDRVILNMSKTQDLTSLAENINKKILKEKRVSKIPDIIFKYLVAFKYHLFIYCIIWL